jgi:hypothetical protein
MPSTYASQANSGYLGTFSIGSPLAAISEIKHVNFPRYTIPDLNVTHLLSPNTTEELVPGLMMPGVVDISGNFIGDSSQTSALDTLAQAQTVFNFAITIPVQNRSKTATITGRGFLNKHDIGPVEGNRPVEFSISVRTTGYSTITVA